MMRLILFILIIFIASPALADERILSYHSEIEVSADGSMQVVESIKVRAEGDQIKRGIYRDFPTDYRDRFGNRVRVDFTVLSVARDGVPEPFHTQPKADGVRLYAGQRNVILDPGIYQYTLTYRTDRQLGYFGDHDELYWNVTGNEWSFPIDLASATVTLPETLSSSELGGAEAYTGYSGDQGRDYEVSVDPSGRVNFRSTRALSQREGLTIVVTWPKGVVHEPSSKEQLNYVLRDNVTWIVAIVGLGLLLIYYVLIWYFIGRDPDQGVVFPHYEPPLGYSPASIRYIDQMGYDHRTFVAALVNLAVKRLINIFDVNDTYTLHRTVLVPTDLVAGEKVLLDKLFPDGSKSLELKQTNHAHIGKVLKAHTASLRRDYEKQYFVTNKKWLVPGILLSLLVYAAVFSQLTGKDTVGLAFGLSVWLSFWTLGVYALVAKTLSTWRGVRSSFDVVPALLITAFATPFVGAEIFVIGLLGVEVAPALPFVLIVAIAVNLLFYVLLKAPTLAGRKLLDRVEGFRLYLNVAEKDEMNLRTPPEKTPELFERFLPYALALDVEQPWAERFADSFKLIETAGESYSPDWYHGRSWDSHSPAHFASAFSGSLSSAVASSSTAPGSSSGSGGGGSSGGGGGGGGGGGW